MYDCLAPAFLWGGGEGKEVVFCHTLFNIPLKLCFCLEPVFMHSQGSLLGYQCCPWGTRQNLVCRKAWGRDAHCSAGSVEVLHALMALLAFTFHSEIVRRQEALHATWSSRN